MLLFQVSGGVREHYVESFTKAIKGYLKNQAMLVHASGDAREHHAKAKKNNLKNKVMPVHASGDAREQHTKLDLLPGRFKLLQETYIIF